MDQVTTRVNGPGISRSFGPFLSMERVAKILTNNGWEQVDDTTFGCGEFICTIITGELADKLEFHRFLDAHRPTLKSVGI